MNLKKRPVRDVFNSLLKISGIKVKDFADSLFVYEKGREVKRDECQDKERDRFREVVYKNKNDKTRGESVILGYIKFFFSEVEPKRFKSFFK